MAREIKFRAKNTKNEWVYGEYAELATQEDYLVPSIIDAGFAHVVNPETLGQYTGLTDKNGKEIYEGDTVAHNGKVRQTELLLVEFVDGAFCLTGEKKTMKENNSCTIRDLMFQAKKCDMELELTIVSTRRANAIREVASNGI